MNPAEFANIAKAEEHFWWYRGMKEILFRVLDPIARQRRFDRVLEGGCGTGYLSKVLEERYEWPMYAVDLGWEGLEYASQMGVRRPIQADISALPFPSSSFDGVLSMDVIVHFPLGQEMRAFRELSRVLKPGGLAVIRVSALDILRSHHSRFAHERQRFTKSRLIRCAQEVGWIVERCTYINSLLFPIALAKFRIWEPLSGAQPSSGVEPVSPFLDRMLYTPLAIEAALIEKGLTFPVGQTLLLVAQKSN
jgi:ubiquinone/menaquinone biosynthesis C-methylase UbiE